PRALERSVRVHLVDHQADRIPEFVARREGRAAAHADTLRRGPAGHPPDAAGGVAGDDNLRRPRVARSVEILAQHPTGAAEPLGRGGHDRRGKAGRGQDCSPHGDPPRYGNNASIDYITAGRPETVPQPVPTPSPSPRAPP